MTQHISADIALGDTESEQAANTNRNQPDRANCTTDLDPSTNP